MKLSLFTASSLAFLATVIVPAIGIADHPEHGGKIPTSSQQITSDPLAAAGVERRAYSNYDYGTYGGYGATMSTLPQTTATTECTESTDASSVGGVASSAISVPVSPFYTDVPLSSYPGAPLSSSNGIPLTSYPGAPSSSYTSVDLSSFSVIRSDSTAAGVLVCGRDGVFL